MLGVSIERHAIHSVFIEPASGKKKRKMPLSHPWMKNINWTKLKENCIGSVYPVKRGPGFMILFLIFGLFFLSAQTAPAEISDHYARAAPVEIGDSSGPVRKRRNAISNAPGPVPNPTNAISNAPDLMQIQILTGVALTFFISIIILFIKCRWELLGHPRGLGDHETEPNTHENRPLLEPYEQLRNEKEQLKNEKETLEKENEKLEKENENLRREYAWRKACCKRDVITLDAGTAHPNLSIAGDKKSFKHEAQPRQVPTNPQRFDSTVCVLGSEGFSSGEHYWEVDVGSSTDWDLGVARKSIQRKGKLSLSPKEGVWALGLSGKDYWAKTDPWTRVMVQKKPKIIGVYLNYQQREVTFFNVNDMSVMFTFNDLSVPVDLYPFFKNSQKETTMGICS
ncbi:E3 ubiquitin-protein ligase TRIM39-like isoform X2 [Chrysemys picta bellii]|uniref:E3 ubiquitin-protein ligase TRIM39-like isoform X2 n=1 Tax=Chrysemys picta bellii TaxID=8478 RepID=UPI0032B27EDC